MKTLELNFTKALTVIFTLLMVMLIVPCALLAKEGGSLVSGGPMVITSESLHADRKANVINFEGNVIARSGGMALYADRMKANYSAEGKLLDILAEGNVKLVKGEQLLRSESATYYASEKKVVFTGKPKAINGPNILTGSVIIYFVDEDKFTVKDSRLLIDNSLFKVNKEKPGDKK